MQASLRSRILAEVKTAFATTSVEVDGVTVAFDFVEIGPLGDSDARRRFSIGIVPDVERYEDHHPFLERTMRIGVEFRITVNRDDAGTSAMSEMVLPAVEWILLNNQDWNELALDTTLVSNNIDVISYADKSILGVVFADIRYRHAYNDPSNPSPSLI